MNIVTLIIDVLLTIPLTIIMLNIEKKENNFIYLVLIPTIYILLISSIIPSIKTNIYLVPIFEVFIRNFYMTNVNEEIKNNKAYLFSSLLSVALVIIIYNYFMTKVTSILPTPEELRIIIWVVIIYVLYLLFKDKSFKQTKTKSLENKDEYILMQYAKFKNKYPIKSKEEDINKLIYAIIIYNNYQLPNFYRNIRNYTNHVLNKEVRYSLLEISSPVPISDEDAIANTKKEFEKQYKKKHNIKDLLTKYNNDEKKEIEYIMKVISKF